MQGGPRSFGTFLAVATVAAVGAMSKKPTPKCKPCWQQCVRGARCRRLRTHAMGHHVVGRSCYQNFPLNYRRHGCVGSIGDRHNGSAEAAAVAREECEEVKNAKSLRLSRLAVCGNLDLLLFRLEAFPPPDGNHLEGTPLRDSKKCSPRPLSQHEGDHGGHLCAFRGFRTSQARRMSMQAA